MSVRIIGEVLDHSEARLSTRLVLIALANCADDETRLAYPSAEWVARKQRLDRSTVYDGFSELEELGEIEQVSDAPPLGVRKNTRVWRIREYRNSRESRPSDGADRDQQEPVSGASRAASQDPPQVVDSPSPQPTEASELPTLSRGGRGAEPSADRGATVGQPSDECGTTVGSGPALNARTDEHETETEPDTETPHPARAQSDLAGLVDKVAEVFSESDRLHVDRVGLENAIAAWPDRDHVRAAHTVLTWVTDPAFRTTNAAKLLGDALSKQPDPEAPDERSSRRQRRGRALQNAIEGRAA